MGSSMQWRAAAAAVVAACAGVGAAHAESARHDPTEPAFRALYKELVEINTTRSVGDCTRAAEAMRQRLLDAGYAAEDMQILAPPEAPKDGALVPVLRGSHPSLKPILLLAHIDVVEAKREDWVRDPFTLVEEDGWFYARGASDDKGELVTRIQAIEAWRNGSLINYLRVNQASDLRIPSSPRRWRRIRRQCY